MYVMIVLMLLTQGLVYLKIKLDESTPKYLKPEIQTQLDKLDDIEKSLSELKFFIESQKTNLRESEARIMELNQEKEKLKPIIEADKKTIEALFLVQEERNRDKVWSERFIGAFFGILSSFIATLIFRLIFTRKSNNGNEKL